MTKLAQIKQELDVIQDVRDKLIKDSREIIPACAKAIREFQAANGLKADGVAGPQTQALLSKHLSKPETEEITY